MDAEVRVFLVSHAIALREAVAAMLDRDPRFEVVGQAETALQARSRVAATRPELVVVTRALPDLPGVELIRDLRAAHPGLRTILFSTWVTDELLAAALDAGAVGVQTYDYLDEQGLSEVLLRAAAGQAVLPADAMRRLLRSGVDPAPDPVDQLTATERAIFDLVGRGYTNPEIAAALHLADGTTRNYVSRLMGKLGVQRRAQVVALASTRARAGPSEAGEPGIPEPWRHGAAPLGS